MDAHSEGNLPRSSQSSSHARPDNPVNHADQSLVCGLCQRVLSPGNEAAHDLETVNLCGDCKFLFLEDIENPRQDSYSRMPSRRRARHNNSSESMVNTFSQQFSHIINLARQNQSSISSNEDGDAGARLMQQTSSHTTPSGSSRWRQVLSDTEIEGADYFDSSWESESNVSFSHYRVHHGDSDVVSFSTYGGESEVSIDATTFLGMDMFAQLNSVGSDSDSDIDPMHTGFNQWNSSDGEEGEEDQEEDEGEEDDEWEEAQSDYVITSPDSRAEPRNFITSIINESNNPNWLRDLSSEYEGTFRWTTTRGRHTSRHSVHASADVSGLPAFIGNSGDYLDARGFDELLEHLAENNSSRRGTPPAAVAFVESLPQLVIGEDNQKYEGSACAICKEMLSIGTVVNQLPCFHLYHPTCILPWLSSRNSCPLCRYELPTDDKDYEEQKHSVTTAMELRRFQQQTSGQNSLSNLSDGADDEEEEYASDQGETESSIDSATNPSRRNRGGGRWFVLAPIVGIVGIVLALWLGNPRGRRGNFPEQNHRQNHGSSSSPNQMEHRSLRRWSII